MNKRALRNMLIEMWHGNVKSLEEAECERLSNHLRVDITDDEFDSRWTTWPTIEQVINRVPLDKGEWNLYTKIKCQEPAEAYVHLKISGTIIILKVVFPTLFLDRIFINGITFENISDTDQIILRPIGEPTANDRVFASLAVDKYKELLSSKNISVYF